MRLLRSFDLDPVTNHSTGCIYRFQAELAGWVDSSELSGEENSVRQASSGVDVLHTLDKEP